MFCPVCLVICCYSLLMSSAYTQSYLDNNLQISISRGQLRTRSKETQPRQSKAMFFNGFGTIFLFLVLFESFRVYLYKSSSISSHAFQNAPNSEETSRPFFPSPDVRWKTCLYLSFLIRTAMLKGFLNCLLL